MLPRATATWLTDQLAFWFPQHSGKRNRSWKKGLSSGTVSSYLVSHSTAPVLVIK